MKLDLLYINSTLPKGLLNASSLKLEAPTSSLPFHWFEKPRWPPDEVSRLPAQIPSEETERERQRPRCRCLFLVLHCGGTRN